MAKKKSRFTKTDVNTICEMQRKICAYEDYIIAISGMIQWKNRNKEYICPVKETELDELMNITWKRCQKLIGNQRKEEEKK